MAQAPGKNWPVGCTSMSTLILMNVGLHCLCYITSISVLILVHLMLLPLYFVIFSQHLQEMACGKSNGHVTDDVT